MKRWIGIAMMGLVMVLGTLSLILTCIDAGWQVSCVFVGTILWVTTAIWLMESKPDKLPQAAYLRIKAKRGPVGTGKL
jgi:hypothetical protein